MTTSAAFNGKIQIDKGQTTTFTVVGNVMNASPELTKDQLDDTEYSDTGRSRIQGLADGNISLEVNLDDGDSGQADLLDAYGDGDLIDVEVSPDDTATSKVVIAFTARVFGVSISQAVEDKVTATIDLQLADGSTPTIGTAFS